MNNLTEYYAEERLGKDAFRCDRCETLFPLTLLVEQDGLRICSVRCHDKPGRIEAQQSYADAMADAGARTVTPLPYAPARSFSGAVAVTGISPQLVRLVRGGSPQTVTLTGVGLSSSHTRSYGHAGITDAVAAVVLASGLSATLSVQASGGVPPGEYDLTYNGGVYKNVFSVR